MIRWSFASLISFALLTSGCMRDPGVLPVVSMKLGDQTFKLEVAATEAAREKGLMERDGMDADHGMIFAFDKEAEVGFWMKNTRFPLDIVFINEMGRVVSVHQMKPYDRTTTPSDYPVRYAIELSLGAAERANVKVGDVVQIPATVK